MKPRGPQTGSHPEWSRFGPLKFALWLPIIFLVVLGLGALMHRLPPAIPIAYTVCSLLSVGLYAHDKSKAQRDVWRTPESTLHILDLLGGWPGGLIAQRIFRHKTRKISFQIIFWLSVLIHLGAWGWILTSVPAEVELPQFIKQVANSLQTALGR
jgi:uncharacterized membrane protein YsdA (DUF1294 family)